MEGEKSMINVQHTRPIGITVITIIVAVYGVLGIIVGITLLGASAGLGVISLVLGVLELVLAWGLWNLQSWAFWATVVIEVLSLINGIFALAQSNAASGILDIVIALAVLVYMFVDPNVRAAFRTG